MSSPTKPQKNDDSDQEKSQNRKLLKSAFSPHDQVRFLPDHFDTSATAHHHAPQQQRQFSASQRVNFDINLYATKKSAAQGLLDLALLMANASQLKYIIMTEGDHRFYGTMIGLLSASIFLQIVVAVGFLILARTRIYDWDTIKRTNSKDEKKEGVDETDAGTVTNQRMEMEALEDQRIRSKLKRADFLNNLIVTGIFILTVINVFISAFGLNESPRREQHFVGKDKP
jgi:hypothetical protein